MNRGRREAGDPPPRRLLRILGSLLYWLAVILISLALVIGLVLLLESQDASDIGGPRSESSTHTRPATHGGRGPDSGTVLAGLAACKNHDSLRGAVKRVAGR